MLNRRTFLGLSAMAGLALAAGCAPEKSEGDEDRAEKAPPEPLKVTRYIDPLPLPAPLKPTSSSPAGDSYEITLSEFSQQLHSELPPTTVWGYAGAYPGPTIEARTGKPVTITFRNELPDEHLFPIDRTLDGSSMGGEMDGAEVRITTHLHGGHVPPESDGWPEDTIIPGGSQTVVYPNDQEAATLWFHDHAMGITRLNVYAGLAAFYLLRDDAEDALDLPKGAFEIPIAFQDRSFEKDASLRYAMDPETEVENSIKPEDFGDVSVVNGKIWPYLEVEPTMYRLRLLNGSNSRFYNLAMLDKSTGAEDGPQFVQIGSEQGLFDKPVAIDGRLLMGPAERADCLVDFSAFAGREFLVHSDAKTPYKKPQQDADEVPLNELMLIRVKDGAVKPGTIPAALVPMKALDPKDAAETREIALVEGEDDDKRLKLMLDGKEWTDPISEKPKLGTTEVWRFVNATEDTHPMHLHLVKFAVLGRTPFDAEKYLEAFEEAKEEGDEKPSVKEFITGEREAPEPNESGWKDTVRATPGYITDIIARFDIKGKYVYHCHIIEHEDHVMMRPFEVV